MSRRPRISAVTLALALVWAASAVACRGGAEPQVPPLSPTAIRGAALVLGTDVAPGYPADAVERTLARLGELGAGWVSVGPFGSLESLEDTTIEFPHAGPYFYDEEDLIATIRAAHAAGLRVFLQPRLWLGGEALWRGDIRHGSEADWAAWFASYRAFILHHARLAAREGVELLSVGLELGGSAHRETEWRALIAEVRGVYGGTLTFSANWWREVQAIRFWDALDLIGVQFFYPLADAPEAGEEALRAGAAAIRERLEAIAARHGRPYVFTEVGYRSTRAPWVRPWEWSSDAPEAPEDQARCYRAVVATFHDAPRFSGLFWWNWHLRPEALVPQARTFSPQGKPAERVLALAFASGRQ